MNLEGPGQGLHAFHQLDIKVSVQSNRHGQNPVTTCPKIMAALWFWALAALLGVREASVISTGIRRTAWLASILPLPLMGGRREGDFILRDGDGWADIEGVLVWRHSRIYK